MHRIKPSIPKLAEKLLKRLLAFDQYKEVAGDLTEVFLSKMENGSRAWAYVWCYFQVSKSIPLFLSESILWSVTMFRNYLKIALRNLRRHKSFTFINVSGLAIGMACCILILVYITDELSYDKYHEHADRIYRLTSSYETAGYKDYSANAPYASSAAFALEIPEITNFTRLMTFGSEAPISYGEKKFREDGVFMADTTFFEVFTYEFVQGNPQGVLSNPGSVVITETTARRLFGDEDPMGKALTLSSFGVGDLLVTGVIKDVPKNSHYTFNYIMSLATFRGQSRTFLQQWLQRDVDAYAYVVLQPGTDPDAVVAKFPEIVEKYTGENARATGIKPEFYLQKFTDIHLRSKLPAELTENGDIMYIYAFAIIGLFLLSIASINFMNLSSARSAVRAKEVGMRKVFGAYRKNLIYQFLSESVSLSLLGLSGAVILAVAVLPSFNAIAGKSLLSSDIFSVEVLVSCAAFIVFTGILAGSYPAFYLSAFRPVNVIKGHLTRGGKTVSIRRFLVVTQFFVSVILIIGTLVVLEQVNFMRQKNLGFDKEQLLAIPVHTGIEREKLMSFKSILTTNPNILNATLTSRIPARGEEFVSFVPEGKGDTESVGLEFMRTDSDFIRTYGVNMIFGEDFSADFAGWDDLTVLINQKATEVMGFGNDAIGKILSIPGSPLKATVKGVFEDFHFMSLKHEIEPMVISAAPFRSEGYLSLRIRPENISGTIAFVENKWTEFDPQREFDYFFLDEDINILYRSENKLITLLQYFAFVAIFIACLGLFGLASFTAEQRSKEIGIRKVLGSSNRTILTLLVRDFAVLVIVGNILAWPVAYFAMDKWLKGFAYRISPGWEQFVGAMFMVIVIALLTVGFQSLKSALANPINSLRDL